MAGIFGMKRKKTAQTLYLLCPVINRIDKFAGYFEEQRGRQAFNYFFFQKSKMLLKEGDNNVECRRQ
jgi:hypothetical protein